MEFKKYYQDSNVVESYDSKRIRGLKGRIFRKLELRFIDFLVDTNEKQDILEIGVGTGFISQLLVRKGRFYGIDISDEMIKKTSKRLGEKKYKKLSKGNILELNGEKKFDYVVTVRVISHFDKKKALLALENVRGCLHEGGRVVFNLENKFYFRRIMRKITHWGSTHTYQYSQREAKKLLVDARFKIEKVVYLDHLFLLPLHLINKLFFNSLEDIIIKIEFGLRTFSFLSNNIFLKCKK